MQTFLSLIARFIVARLMYSTVKKTHQFTYMYYVAPETPMMSSVIADCLDLVPQYFGQILGDEGRPGLRKRAHPFTLPLKDDKQCIPRVLYRALLPPVQS